MAPTSSSSGWMFQPARQRACSVFRTKNFRKLAMPEYCEPVTPLNKLSTVEWAENLAALNSTAFVDLAPLQVNEKMLDAGICLGSAYTFYQGVCKVLCENSAY
ncbi:hypothetical protein [Arthrobacter polaris]|uniref:hypothetical protein n=1 Tax=Arthrobacter polaris TaxID=2813727 RepID=UPI001F3CBD42|nr:hypothetical protein [Arthrobacter polaris]UIK89764.1 hypothetical protein J0916_05230 [Arthrobacter polaris]